MSGNYPKRDPQMFYELARERHATQAALFDAVDTKLGLLLSGSSTLIGILVAVFALRPDAVHRVEWALLGGSALAWGTLTWIALTGLWIRVWKTGPTLEEVFRLHFTQESEQRLKWRVSNAFWHDYNFNRDRAERKRDALRGALKLFVTQTVLLVLALALVASG